MENLIAAVNIADLSQLGIAASILVMPHSRGYHAPIGPGVDNAALVIEGPADQIDAVMDLLVNTIGPKRLKYRLRCWVRGPKKGWRRVRAA